MITRRIADLEVPAIGLGGMPLSLKRRPPEHKAIEVIRASIEAGVRLIDTADAYCRTDDDLGHNERLIAEALAGRDDVIVATKGGLERPRGRWVTNGRPDHLKAACDKSLQNLGVEQIALYQLHAPDGRVPFADSVGALKELKDAGKIARVGLSNVSVQQLAEARAIVDIVSVQNRCNYFDRTALDEGVVRACEIDGIAFLAYSPVGGSREKERVADDPRLTEIASKHDASPYQVALAWLLTKSPVMIPIPGASRIESARSSAAAMDLVLDDDDLDRLG
jgi:aryl-alcohol dehydrogenase-like predicted oxidoreductase